MAACFASVNSSASVNGSSATLAVAWTAAQPADRARGGGADLGCGHPCGSVGSDEDRRGLR
eukprot:595916-Rhodomonas_salina.1